MTTAIVVSNSEGVVGRCDAKCHYAAKPDCDCICGGRLHGTGRDAIAKNTRDHFGADSLEEALDAFAERNDLDRDDLRVDLADVQGSLL